MKHDFLLTALKGFLLAALLILPAFGPDAIWGQTEDTLDVLFLTKSSGYEHQVIHRDNGELGHTEKIMLDLAKKHGFRIVITKDAGVINRPTLDQFDVVQFYTTGALCERGNDKNPPMSEKGRVELLEWIKDGGGFVGTHTASDTFHNWIEGGEKPYIRMLGGEFAFHKSQQQGEMAVQPHATTKHLGDQWNLVDEYYAFKNVTDFNPLLILNPQSMKEPEYRRLDPYATSWYKSYGEGRVWHTALGHRDDVWTNPKYQEFVARGIQWAAGELE